MSLLEQKREVTSFRFSKLLKLEVPQFVEKMIEILEKYDLEALQVAPMSNLLLAEQPNIDTLTVPYAGHPITPKLVNLRVLLRLQLRSIALDLKMLLAKNAAVEIDGLQLLKIEIPRFLSKLRDSKNEEIMLRKVQQFVTEVTVNPDLADAVKTHGLTDSFNTLRMTLSEINENLNKRLASYAKRIKAKTGDLTASVTMAARNMTQDINLAQLRNPELNYLPLVNDLNELLNMYKVIINKRLLHNKKKAAEKKALKNAGLTIDNTAEVDNPNEDPQIKKAPIEHAAPTNGRLEPKAEQVNSNSASEDTHEGLEQNKAVLMDLKSIQPPNVSNDNNHAAKVLKDVYRVTRNKMVT